MSEKTRFVFEVDNLRNAAMVDEQGNPDHVVIAELLREAASKLYLQVEEGRLRDVNGNTVGRFGFHEERENADYYRGEVDGLGDAELFSIKVQTRGDLVESGATKWMSISPGQLRQIQMILGEVHEL